MSDNAKLLEKVELVSIDEVYPYSNNAKEHPDEQVDKIAASIREFGWDQPIVTDLDGEIIKGHGRYRAAKRLGYDVVPVIRNEYETEAEKRAARLADNRVAESDWDSELLQNEINRLAEENFDLELTGFDDGELKAMLDDVEPDISMPEGESQVDGPEDQSGHILATLMVDVDDWPDVKSAIQELASEYDIELEVA